MGGVYDVSIILSCSKWKMEEEERGQGTFFLQIFCEVIGGNNCMGKWNEKVMDFGR